MTQSVFPVLRNTYKWVRFLYTAMQRPKSCNTENCCISSTSSTTVKRVKVSSHFNFITHSALFRANNYTRRLNKRKPNCLCHMYLMPDHIQQMFIEFNQYDWLNCNTRPFQKKPSQCHINFAL